MSRAARASHAGEDPLRARLHAVRATIERLRRKLYRLSPGAAAAAPVEEQLDRLVVEDLLLQQSLAPRGRGARPGGGRLTRPRRVV